MISYNTFTVSVAKPPYALRIYDLRTLAIYDADPAMRQLNTQSFYCFRLTVGSDISLENDGKFTTLIQL